jgi:hypothetical protein
VYSSAIFAKVSYKFTIITVLYIYLDKSDKGEGLHSLYVKKAIVFDRGGFSFIDVFRVPRKCTYFVNYFTRACTDGKRGDGEEIEIELDCPMYKEHVTRTLPSTF